MKNYLHFGRGRKNLFDRTRQETIKQWVKANPKNLGKVQDKIFKEWGVTTSKDTIKRIIKSAKMGWLRIKRAVGGKPLLTFYKRKIKELNKLKEQEKTGKIEIRYVDETGFCLTAYIPYAWPLIPYKNKGGLSCTELILPS